MKKSFPSFVVPFIALLLLGVAMSVQAQDDGITAYDLQNSGVDVAEPESRTSRNLISNRDSLQISDFYQKPRATDRKTAAATDAETTEEDDALSLNFLFYIIENYKFSDLMDE